MADISITAANVIKGAGASTNAGIAGATITAGQYVYQDSTDSNKYKLVDADASITGSRGIALHGAADGQPLTVCTAGNINPGGTVAVGQVYVGSTNAGGIAPYADIGTDDYVYVIGVGTSATNIFVEQIYNGNSSPIQKP